MISGYASCFQLLLSQGDIYFPKPQMLKIWVLKHSKAGVGKLTCWLNVCFCK